MCGIVVAHAHHPVAPAIDRAEIVRMRETMAARGPDGSGLWVSADGRTAIAHRRLAIVQPGPSNAQPLVCRHTGLVLAWNGELYDGTDLVRRLRRAGVQRAMATDSEAILAAWEQDGPRCLEYLVGMFALAVWDPRDEAIHLARDPYGHKPLYYADDGWTLRAASQVRTLQAGAAIDETRDDAGLVGFLTFGSVPEPFTMLRAVRSVPAGSHVRCGSRGAEAPRPFGSVSALFSQLGTRPVRQEAVTEAVTTSIRRHLVGSRKVGVLLSGGLDSGLVAAHAALSPSPPAVAITVRFEGFTTETPDEVAAGAELARRLGMHHVVHRVDAHELRAALPQILSAMDQPTIDGINVWFAARAAREAGCSVVLTGMGGDELFGGYPSFRQIPRVMRIAAWPARVPGLGRATRIALGPLARRAPKLASLLEFTSSVGRAWLLRRAVFLPWEVEGLIGVDRARAAWRRLGATERLDAIVSAARQNRGRIAALESSWYLRHQLLRDADWAGMAHGVEVRAPLADFELTRAVVPHLPAHRVPEDKPMLAAAWPSTIEQPRRGPRVGFGTPLEACARELSSSGHSSAVRGGGRGARSWAVALAEKEAWL